MGVTVRNSSPPQKPHKNQKQHPPNNCQPVILLFLQRLTCHWRNDPSPSKQPKPSISLLYLLGHNCTEMLVEQMPAAEIPDSGADAEVSADCGIVWVSGEAGATSHRGKVQPSPWGGPRGHAKC